MKPLLILCLALALSLSATTPSHPADAGTPAKDYPIVFSDVTRQAGLLEPLAGIMGHGGAWGDFDGDGHIDLYVGGFCDRPDSEYRPAKGPVPNRLFRNLSPNLPLYLNSLGSIASRLSKPSRKPT